MKEYIIAPSLLAVKKENLLSAIKPLENLKNLWLHFDVMDGKFVPNTSFSLDDLKLVKDNSNLFLDVHLMINNPLEYIDGYIENGASLVTIHYEAEQDIEKFIKICKEKNVKAGVSIKPKTDIDCLLPYLSKLDLVLIMSVEPGFGGQAFIETSLEKIEKLRKIIDEFGYDCLIEVDGGINKETSLLVKEKGVDVLVAGSYLFGHEDILDRILDMRK